MSAAVNPTPAPAQKWHGPVRLRVDADLAARYRATVGETTSPHQVRVAEAVVPVAPPFVLSLAVNRAAALIPSPPGSVHARQRFTFLRPIQVGADLQVRVRPAGREVRRGRTHVVLEYRITDAGGSLVATAESRTVWAEPQPESR